THRARSHLAPEQRPHDVLPPDSPTFRLSDTYISSRLYYLPIRFHPLAQPFHRRPRQWPPSSPTAFVSRLDGLEAFRQPAFAGPAALQRSSLTGLSLA